MPNEIKVEKTVDELMAEVREEAREAAKGYIIDPPDDEASEAAKSMAKHLPGEIEKRIRESVEKALRDKQAMASGGTEAERLTQMTDFGEGKAHAHEVRGQPASDSLKGHWLTEAGETDHEIGSGKLAADYLFYAMRSCKARGGVDLEYIREDAAERGSKQIEEIVDKNIQSTDFSEGGALLPEEFADDFIGFLHGRTAVRQLDHVSMELNNEMVQGRFSSAATANYRGEGGTVQSSTPGTDELRFSENELVVRVIQSERFIRNAPAGALQAIRDDMRRVSETKQDSVLLRSSGTQNEPTGILNLVDQTNNRFNINATDPNTPDQIMQDLVKCQKLVHADGAVPQDRPSYIMPQAVKQALMVLTDADNNLSSLAMMLQQDDSIFGVPVLVTNQIPKDLGNSSDETEVYYVEGSEYVIADAEDVRVRELNEATVTDSQGNDRKLADRGEMAIQLTLSHDAGLRHNVGAAVAEQVDWHTEAF